MDKGLVQQAQDNLDLVAIKLHKSLLERADEFYANSDIEHIEAMRQVRAQRLTGEDTSGETIELFRVFVTLGLREAVPNQPDRRFTFEATFRADYQIKGGISNEALNEFAKYNSLHNVWSFWREYVANTFARADLPDIPIGLFPRVE